MLHAYQCLVARPSFLLVPLSVIREPERESHVAPASTVQVLTGLNEGMYEYVRLLVCACVCDDLLQVLSHCHAGTRKGS